MRHLDLFAGIGGFSLAARWMGWETVAMVEINPFCQRVLKHHFPEAELHGDIKEYKGVRGAVDIITGGFPCQPYSSAGKRKGTDDPRHLWPEMLRVIREVSPSWVVGENVRGLTNWNGGLVFDQVQADLEAEGYEVIPFLLPSAGVGAPHRRDRIWFVAYSADAGIKGMRPTGENALHELGTSAHAQSIRREEKKVNGRKEYGPDRDATNTSNQRLQGGKNKGNFRGSWAKSDKLSAGLFQSAWQDFPTQYPVCFRNDGLSSRLDGITISKHRKESIKGAGNAIVPQVVYQIFKAIEG